MLFFQLHFFLQFRFCHNYIFLNRQCLKFAFHYILYLYFWLLLLTPFLYSFITFFLFIRVIVIKFLSRNNSWYYHILGIIFFHSPLQITICLSLTLKIIPQKFPSFIMQYSFMKRNQSLYNISSLFGISNELV